MFLLRVPAKAGIKSHEQQCLQPWAPAFAGALVLSYKSIKIRVGSSIAFLSATRKVTASRPSTRRRSEEHTSELQSLMRSSYAVFCLKKKKASRLRPRSHKHKNKLTTI